MRMMSPLCLALLVLAGCEAMSAHDRPMDEVPREQRLPNGDRQYGFQNGCVIVLEPQRAVVKSEGTVCALHHRDIALLYASAD
ncbi:hypothetical protein [Paracoccus siganidrum]|uniref:hypothetical protein n=1 Tax=Paracoccus siganidrum TaxID=1276757 RepID=UPI000E76A646|nr:hypothetical protein [Paracoccus siganidrum]RMC26530.1 hypothetical protein C9E82_22645 [Paracoccus siganidrum]